MKIEHAIDKIKLIAIDLDGTLLNDNGVAGHESLRLIEKLQNEGVQFAFASGRMYAAITSKLNGIKADIIALDGLVIKEYPENVLLLEHGLSKSFCSSFIHFAEQNKINFALYGNEKLFCTENNFHIAKILKKYDSDSEIVENYFKINEKICQIIVVEEDKELIDYILQSELILNNASVNTICYSNEIDESFYYLEIKPAGVNKKTGLEHLAKSKSIEMSEIAFIGDWYNDAVVFDTEVLKITLKNGILILKQKADMIIDKTNNEDGVAEFLKLFLKR